MAISVLSTVSALPSYTVVPGEAVKRMPTLQEPQLQEEPEEQDPEQQLVQSLTRRQGVSSGRWRKGTLAREPVRG